VPGLPTASLSAKAEFIDIVIMHVDGTVPGFEAVCRQYTGTYIPCQYRSLGELRYVLRSIERYAPWGRVTLVVQGHDHVPDWVDPTSVRVVLHEEFIPPDLLPTFNFHTIFGHVNRIEGLSERFVVWSDDVVAGQAIPLDLLFDAYGQPRTHYGMYPIFPLPSAKTDDYQYGLTQTAAAFARSRGRRDLLVLYPHMSIAMTRASWQCFERAFASEKAFQATLRRRNRGDVRQVLFMGLKEAYANWNTLAVNQLRFRRRLGMLAREMLVQLAWRFSPWPPAARPLFDKYAVVNDLVRMRAAMERLTHTRATFMNINDEAYDRWDGPGSEERLNPASQALLTTTLETMFPTRSRFERA
jgi:hypothetical protein